MPMVFTDRHAELEFLERVRDRHWATAGQMLLMYGRRRIGKSSLLRHWVAHSGFPATYWVAERDGAELQRRKLYAAVSELPLQQAPHFESWGELWAALANLIVDRPRLIVLDELPYAMESDPALLSSLQRAWDLELRDLPIILVLCGSHVAVMERILSRQSPLFGRLAGQWELRPLPFGALRDFFPRWSMEQRVATWSLVGGVPAYLEWLDPGLTLEENIREVVLAPGSMFVAEPLFLLYDEVREPRNYLAILKAIGAGAHAMDAIARATMIDKRHLTAYLTRLVELKLVERRLPATLNAAQQRKSRRGRYHLRDAYFRFYFRFLGPQQMLSPYDPAVVFGKLRGELDAFIGTHGFEELAQTWVTSESAVAKLGFAPAQVGRHWDRSSQADLVAPNFEGKAVLIGECKWQAKPVGKAVVDQLAEHTAPAALAALPDEGRGWDARLAIFSRAGFTRDAKAALRRRGGLAVDLPALDKALRLR